MVLVPLGSLCRGTAAVVVEAEDMPAPFVSQIERYMASMMVAGCRVVSGTAVASTVAVEVAVAAGTVCEVAPGSGMAETNADCGIVGRPECPGSIRQKPWCFLWCVRSISGVDCVFRRVCR